MPASRRSASAATASAAPSSPKRPRRNSPRPARTASSRARSAASTAATAMPGRQCRGHLCHRNLQHQLHRRDGKADNYDAGGNFKTTPATGRAGHTLPLDEVGSTAYETRNQTLGFALRRAATIWSKPSSATRICPRSCIPNQRMDMLDNEQKRFNLRYLGQFDWGDAGSPCLPRESRPLHGLRRGQALLVRQCLAAGRPSMASPVRRSAATCAAGMPMYTEGKTTGASLSRPTSNLDAQDIAARRRRIPALSARRLVAGLRAPACGPDTF